MEYNEKDFPKRIYFVTWYGGLTMLLRLNPDKFKISNVDKVGMPYAYIRMLDCTRGEKWNLSDYQAKIKDCLTNKTKFSYSLLSKDWIVTILSKEHGGASKYTLDEELAKVISKETWKRENPTGEAYDVVSYWDDYDRKVVNSKPLLYSEARKLCDKYLSTSPHGSLYYYTVEVHKNK